MLLHILQWMLNSHSLYIYICYNNWCWFFFSFPLPRIKFVELRFRSWICSYPEQNPIDFDSDLKVGCKTDFDSQPFKPIAIAKLLILYKYCKSNMGTDNLTRKWIAQINCLWKQEYRTNAPSIFKFVVIFLLIFLLKECIVF